MTLDDILTEHKNNILNFVELCKGKTIAFDFDGTLTRFQYDTSRMLPCKDSDIEEYTKSGKNIYKNIQIFKTMKFIISQLNMADIFIVTSTVPSLREIKNKIIFENFGIRADRILHTYNSSEKIDVLRNIYTKNKKDILFVEDNFKILLAAEETLSFVRGYLISSLWA